VPALHRLQALPRHLQASVGAVLGLRREAHGGAVAAARVRDLVIRAGSVPRQPHEDRAPAAVIVVQIVEKLRDIVVHLQGPKPSRAVRSKCELSQRASRVAPTLRVEELQR